MIFFAQQSRNFSEWHITMELLLCCFKLQKYCCCRSRYNGFIYIVSKKIYIYSNVWIPSQTLAFNVTDWKYQESGSVQAAKWKIPGGVKTVESGQKGMKMWLIPSQTPPPWVKCVWKERCVRSVYYQPFSTALKHARTETLHFHFSLGWAVIPEYQAPPLPKCDPLRFTSSIKTFQWSLDGVLSPCKKAPPMGRCPSSPPPKKNEKKKKNHRMLQWWNVQALSNLFNIFFPPLLSGYYSLSPTGSNAISDTLLLPWHSASNTHLLCGATGRLTHTSSLPGNCTHTRPDWQINVRDECKQTRPEASLITITPLLYRLVKRFTVWETICPTGLQVPPHRL